MSAAHKEKGLDVNTFPEIVNNSSSDSEDTLKVKQDVKKTKTIRTLNKDLIFILFPLE